MAYCHLTEDERYCIAYLHARGMSIRWIAAHLDRAASTISREYRRNKSAYDGKYRAERAQMYARARRSRRRGSRLTPMQWRQVHVLLNKQWSPEQASHWLRRHGQLHVSTRSIYRHVWQEKKEGGRLWRQLRILSKFARKVRGSPATRGKMAGKRHISERPAHVQQRLEVGHWEGDTVMGCDQRHCVLTLVERATGAVIVRKLKARTKQQTTSALIRAIRHSPRLFTTLTLDNGTEFHGFADVQRATGVQVFFATPYHSWERGTNENTNGLLRQYLPKGMCMRNLNQRACNKIARKLNNRPRKRLSYNTPNEVLSGHAGVALDG